MVKISADINTNTKYEIIRKRILAELSPQSMIIIITRQATLIHGLSNTRVYEKIEMIFNLWPDLQRNYKNTIQIAGVSNYTQTINATASDKF